MPARISAILSTRGLSRELPCIVKQIVLHPRASINDSPWVTTDSPQLPDKNGNLTNKTLCYSGLSETPKIGSLPCIEVGYVLRRPPRPDASRAPNVAECQGNGWKSRRKQPQQNNPHENGEIGRQVGVGLGKVCHTHEESLQKHPVLKSPK